VHTSASYYSDERVHAVAIGRTRGDVDAVVADVAMRLGRSHAEIRQRMRQLSLDAGEDPIVLGVHRDTEIAFATAAMLREHGFDAHALPVHRPVPNLRVARGFVIDEGLLRIEDREGRSADLQYAEIDALVLARSYSHPAPPRESAVAPGFGHTFAAQLTNAATQGRTHGGQPTHEGLVYVFGAAHCCALREHELRYQSFGAALQLSRGANFRQLVDRLRERCTQAVYDARLVRPAAQSHILGPMFAVDVRLELAAALVAASVRRAVRGPYR